MTPPAEDQLEVSIFGPGYGESILVHIGSGNWICIDSCVDRAGACIPLSYLKSIGVDIENCVRLIAATHWHDDHVRGLSELVANCSSAEVAISSAMATTEFIAMARARRELRMTKATSGVDEAYQLFELLRKNGREVRRAQSDLPLLTIHSGQLAHSHAVKVTALSPSDAQIQLAMDDIASLTPSVKQSEDRCYTRGPNHTAVVIWIEVGPLHLLFGADLEETSNPKTGWSVIVNSTHRPQAKACVFKVAHHGSANGHSNDVCAQMLAAPISIVTPYTRGRVQLPSKSDVERILNYSSQAYLTADAKRQKVRKNMPSAVEKTLKEAGLSIFTAEPFAGHVQLRNGGTAGFQDWSVNLFGPAHQLERE